MNDPALVAAARRLRTAHIAYDEATAVWQAAAHELAEAGREHRILLMSTEEVDLIEAPQ
ncbi:MAG: hypothetical protein VW547_10860 [Alphaproteobacteria bacterium]